MAKWNLNHIGQHLSWGSGVRRGRYLRQHLCKWDSWFWPKPMIHCDSQVKTCTGESTVHASANNDQHSNDILIMWAQAAIHQCLQTRQWACELESSEFQNLCFFYSPSRVLFLHRTILSTLDTESFHTYAKEREEESHFHSILSLKTVFISDEGWSQWKFQ